MQSQKISRLFKHIEMLQGGRPWGRLLDAGTGRNSIAWVSSLATDSWTAVTASRSMARAVREHAGPRMRAQDRIVLGNWIDPDLLDGERFDTVLLDYFLGAIEGFAPYWQSQAIPRMHPLVEGRLYVIGVDPYVPIRAADESGLLIGRIGRLRDACLLLAGERPYREYPMEWVLDQLRLAGLRILEARRFPIRYRERFVNGQLDMCVERLGRIGDPVLANALGQHVEALREQALSACARLDGLRHGSDYVIAAEPGDARSSVTSPG